MANNKLTISKKSFFEMLSDLIQSGVTFEAEETKDKESIEITFTGGY